MHEWGIMSRTCIMLKHYLLSEISHEKITQWVTRTDWHILHVPCSCILLHFFFCEETIKLILIWTSPSLLLKDKSLLSMYAFVCVCICVYLFLSMSQLSLRWGLHQQNQNPKADKISKKRGRGGNELQKQKQLENDKARRRAKRAAAIGAAVPHCCLQ